MMDEVKKHAVMLSLLLVLILIKFVVVPVFDWQEGLIVDIANQQKKRLKTASVLGSENDLKNKNARLVVELQKVEPLFFAHQSETAFKLSQQQAFEALFEKHQVKTNNIGWQTSSEIKDLSLLRYQVNISFDGNLVDVIALYTALESARPWLQIQDFNLSTRGANAEKLGLVIGGRVTVNLFMQYSPSIESDV